VGLSVDRSRRVPGLRREEVATLAGVSTDYYVRLEQGRERHPSTQVLHAVARALLLDASRLEENAAAQQLTLTGDQLRRLDAITPPVGDRYPDMTPIGR
jgi:transcriptional regulator with XRE-family HTH domain